MAQPRSAPTYWLKTPAQAPCSAGLACWTQITMARFLSASEASGRLRGSRL